MTKNIDFEFRPYGSIATTRLQEFNKAPIYLQERDDSKSLIVDGDDNLSAKKIRSYGKSILEKLQQEISEDKSIPASIKERNLKAVKDALDMLERYKDSVKKSGARLAGREKGIQAYFLERLTDLIRRAKTDREIDENVELQDRLLADLNGIRNDLIASSKDENENLFRSIRKLKRAVEKIEATNFRLEASYAVKRIQERSVPPALLSELRRTSHDRLLNRRKLDSILKENYGINFRKMQSLLRETRFSEADLSAWSPVNYPAFRKEFLANRKASDYLLEALIRNDSNRFIDRGNREYLVTPVMWARLFHHVGVFYGKVGSEGSGARRKATNR
jgi:hypothetical protein